MKSPLLTVAVIASAGMLFACAPQFQSNVTPIRVPTSYSSSYEKNGLQIGFEVLSPAKQIEHFGVDLTPAEVMPIRIVVRNDAEDEYYIQAGQVFGVTPAEDLYPSYRLDQTVDRIRKSQIGNAMASGAATGLLVGAAVGAAAGAAIGGSVGDAGQGAAVGAAVGGTSGGLTGATAAMDATSRAIKKELRKVDWGDRVVYPGRTEHGFLFMKSGIQYTALEILLYDVNKRKNTRIRVPLAPQ